MKKGVDKVIMLCYIAGVISVIAQLANMHFRKVEWILIFIDYHSRVPIYEQIKEQIIMLINSGVYKPDEQLPSIRAMSSELNINVNTIKRAFADLERDGITYSAQGRGIFVAESSVDNEKVKKTALENIRVSVNSGKTKGVKKEDIIALVNEMFKEESSDD